MQIIHRLHRFSQRDKLGGGVNKSAQSASSADQKNAAWREAEKRKLETVAMGGQ